MILVRPLRSRSRFDIHALALDAPLPIAATCKGMRLPWPAANAQDVPTLPQAETDLFATEDYDRWPSSDGAPVYRQPTLSELSA